MVFISSGYIIHKSLQDYFSAEYISFTIKKDEILENIYSSGKYFKYANILDFIAEIDYSVFRNTMIYRAICEYVEFYENNIVFYKRFTNDQYNTRISMLFGAECYLTDDVRDDELNEKLDVMIKNNEILDYDYSFTTNLCLALGYTNVARLVLNYIRSHECEDIFIDKRVHPSENTLDNDAEEISHKVNSKIINIKQDSKQFYNTLKYFDKVNNIYIQLMDPDTAVMSYEKCKLVKEDVERRKVAGSDSDDLSGL